MTKIFFLYRLKLTVSRDLRNRSKIDSVQFYPIYVLRAGSLIRVFIDSLKKTVNDSKAVKKYHL